MTSERGETARRGQRDVSYTPTVLWVETIRIPHACGRVRVGGRMHVTTGIAVTFRRIWKIRGCKVTDNIRLVLGLILLVLRTFCHVLINGSQ